MVTKAFQLEQRLNLERVPAAALAFEAAAELELDNLLAGARASL